MSDALIGLLLLVALLGCVWWSLWHAGRPEPRRRPHADDPAHPRNWGV